MTVSVEHIINFEQPVQKTRTRQTRTCTESRGIETYFIYLGVDLLTSLCIAN